MNEPLHVEWSPAYGDGTLLIPSRISWTPAAPLELTLVFGLFGTDDPNNVVWVFGRDLIAEAARNFRAGNGDVQVEIISGVLALSLNNSEKAIVLTTNAQPLVDFVNQTFEAVGPEQEFHLLSLSDDALATWLEGC